MAELTPETEEPVLLDDERLLHVVVSFDDFYAAHSGPIARALVLSLGNADLGVDACQEAMTRAYARWSKVSTYRNPAGWVYRVGLNWARSRLRKRRRERLDVFTDAGYQPPASDPELDAALAGLSVDHRAVVVCRYLLDWSVQETAVALGVAPGTVKSRLSRALDQLHDHLGASQ